MPLRKPGKRESFFTSTSTIRCPAATIRTCVSVRPGRTETQVLIVAAGHLIVEVDVKKLSRFPGLRNGMGKIQSGHMLVSDFRINSDHFLVFESFDETDRKSVV